MGVRGRSTDPGQTAGLSPVGFLGNGSYDSLKSHDVVITTVQYQ